MNKKIKILMLLMLLSLVFVACSNTKKIEVSENILNITITSQPQSDSNERYYTDSEKIEAISSYLAGLNLKLKFSENPDEYAGMTYVITINNENGSQDVYYHFGNMFLGHEIENAFVWYRMSYEEATKLDKLIQSISSDY